MSRGLGKFSGQEMEAIQRRQAQREWEGIPKPRPYRPKSRGTATRAQLEAIRQALIKMVNS